MNTERMNKDQKINAVRSLVEDLFRSLVKYPDAVHVTAVVGSFNVIFEATMLREDIGRAVGLNGSQKERMQRILNAIGKNHGLSYTIDRVRDSSA